MYYAFIIGGIALLLLGSSINRDLNKYEFNNRTDGGVIQFKDYEASISHKRKRGFAGILMRVGMIAIVVGIILKFA